MKALVGAIITGLALLIFGLYLVILKDVVTDEDIIIFLFFWICLYGLYSPIIKRQD